MTAFLRVFAEQRLELAVERGDELVLYRFVYQQIIRRDAGLPGIQALAPCDAPCGDIDFGVAIDDARAFAAEFEYDGSQMPGCGGHDGASERRTAGEEYDVVAAVEQSGVHVAIALDCCDILLVERVGNHLLDDGRDVRLVGRRFEYGGTACRNRTDERIEQQLHGIVPRSDDERGAERLADYAAARRKHFQRRAAAFGCRPARDVFQMIVDFAENNADFGQVRLLVGFVQIAPQSLGERLFPFVQSLFQAAQRKASHRDVERSPLRKYSRWAATILSMRSVDVLATLIGGQFLRPVKLSIAEKMPKHLPKRKSNTAVGRCPASDG